LHLATRSGAARPADFTRIIVDTTVQPKAITFPTDAKLQQRPSSAFPPALQAEPLAAPPASAW